MSAVISECGAYRYHLTRGSGRLLPFVMLNPSTADSDVDDPTIRRCRAFATREGYQGIEVVNLYALRSIEPKALLEADYPVGTDNDYWLDRIGHLHRHGRIVAAWGAWGGKDHLRHAVTCMGALTRYGARLVCLGKTGSGAPRHPLYVRGATPLEPWP